MRDFWGNIKEGFRRDPITTLAAAGSLITPISPLGAAYFGGEAMGGNVAEQTTSIGGAALPIVAGGVASIIGTPAAGSAVYSGTKALQSGVVNYMKSQQPQNIFPQMPQFTPYPNFSSNPMPQQSLSMMPEQQSLAQAQNQLQSAPQMTGSGVSDNDYWRIRNDIPMYRKGGVVVHDKINIEKGELEVDPEDLSVVREFEAPKHPKDGSKNPQGDRYVKKGNAIIPADKAMKFKKGTEKEKQNIMDGLPEHTKVGMAKDGIAAGGVWDYGTNNDIQYPEQPQQMTMDAGQQTTPVSYAPVVVDPYANYQQGNLATATATATVPQNNNSYYNLSGIAMGAYQMYNADKALKALNKQPLPTLSNYNMSPEIQSSYNRAEGLTNRGYTPEEEAAFKQNIAENRNAAYRNATDMSGGSLSGAISGVLNAQKLGAYNQFAAEDAALKRRNIQYADSLARALQAQQNMHVQGIREYESMLYQRRLMTEQALAAAKSQGMQNIANSTYVQQPSMGNVASLATALA